MENEVLDILDSSSVNEGDTSHNYTTERVEDSPMTEDTLYINKDNLPNYAISNRDSDGVLSDASFDAEEAPMSEDVINSDKIHQSAAGEMLTDHHHDLSSDTAVSTCSEDDTSDRSGSPSLLASSFGAFPIAAELSDAEMEMESPVFMDSSKGKASDVRVGDEMIKDIPIDIEGAFLSDSTSNEYSDDESDDEFNLSDDSDLSNADDSSDNEMLYVNEAELSDLGYASNNEEYDSDRSSDEESKRR